MFQYRLNARIPMHDTFKYKELTDCTIHGDVILYKLNVAKTTPTHEVSSMEQMLMF